MTSHEFALQVARIIRESLYVHDGSLEPCTGGVLNPLWVNARANNAATVIAELFESEGRKLAEAVTARGAVVRGEINLEVPEERPQPCKLNAWCGIEDGHDGDCLMPF